MHLSKWNMHFFFCKRTRKVSFILFAVLKNIDLKGGIFEDSNIHEGDWKEQSLKLVLWCLGCHFTIAGCALSWGSTGLGQADGIEEII